MFLVLFVSRVDAKCCCWGFAWGLLHLELEEVLVGIFELGHLTDILNKILVVAHTSPFVIF